MKPSVSLFWFRRDLRLDDNHGLFMALRSGLPVLPVFVFDSIILDRLRSPKDARVDFIYRRILQLQEELNAYGSSLWVKKGTPEEVFTELGSVFEIKSVFANHDYEPYARQRDEQMGKEWEKSGIAFYTFKDQVLIEKSEIVKENGAPYTIYTPYSRLWKKRWTDPPHFPSELNLSHLYKTTPLPLPSIERLGFQPLPGTIPPVQPDEERIREYHLKRDIPAIDATTRMGVHLRFGTFSIRKLARLAANLNETYLNELIWREFYMMLLWHFPHVVASSFKPVFDRISWLNRDSDFRAWCEGRTGYPLVDAGMRQLNSTGYMHNRLRMVTASFLTKHLLIDWRWGEQYFADLLLDYELASNNGGWQWAAGTGADAAPYFRVFNPALQAQKFDPDQVFIRRYIPEYGTSEYPKPIVDHVFARNRALEYYRRVLILLFKY